ncbi:MAG TPA: acetyl-CoA carboxylase biotin carboxyl carrier protein subunit [Chitinophagaceae bacterium]|nr:acetyl-CoA carboxylase biotin carboxyl carrier protein subunit [Chitinophagaceae bacterium]
MADDNKIYKVKANEFLFFFTRAAIGNIDIVKISPTEFNIIKDRHSINAKLVEADTTGKKLKIEIEGEIFDIEIKDELDQVLEKMGFGTVTNKVIKEIKAPMPGLVLEIAVADGQDVKEGDKILILGAMKMENCIMIHTNAKVKKVVVAAGQAVEKGQVLVELE